MFNLSEKFSHDTHMCVTNIECSIVYRWVHFLLNWNGDEVWNIRIWEMMFVVNYNFFLNSLNVIVLWVANIKIAWNMICCWFMWWFVDRFSALEILYFSWFVEFAKDDMIKFLWIGEMKKCMWVCITIVISIDYLKFQSFVQKLLLKKII